MQTQAAREAPASFTCAAVAECLLGASLVLAVAVSLAAKARPGRDTIETRDVRFATSPGFNAGALAVGLVLIILCATLW